MRCLIIPHSEFFVITRAVGKVSCRRLLTKNGDQYSEINYLWPIGSCKVLNFNHYCVRVARITVVLAFVWLAGILYLAYGVERYETARLLTVYGISFVAYLGLVKIAPSAAFRWLLGLAVVARLALLPVLPHLSDDIYRFVWDGRLLYQGYDPFAYLPSEIISGAGEVEAHGINQALYQQLNSPDYYTIYPPVNQAVFALAAWVSPTSVWGSTIVIRAILILAALMTLWLMTQLFRQKRSTISNDQKITPSFSIYHSVLDIPTQSSSTIPLQNVLLYALNPLVIIELTGNLHFEALMITFLLGSVYWLRRNVGLSAVLFGLAVCTKLVPLILLPLYWRRLGWREALLFYGLVALTTAALFFPLITPELVAGMQKSIGLYFQKFEFNASAYYIIREIGFYQKGYNIIAQAGRWLAISTFLGIMLYAAWERNHGLPTAYSGAWLIFLLLSTTVHPWYVTPLLAFTVFTSYRYAVAWSGLIFLTYAGYSITGFAENLWVTGVEYIIVLAILGYETVMAKHTPTGLFRKI